MNGISGMRLCFGSEASLANLPIRTISDLDLRPLKCLASIPTLDIPCSTRWSDVYDRSGIDAVDFCKRRIVI